MRSIIKIAKAELRYLFYSPIAWVVIIAFLVLCALAWSNIVPGLAEQQERALENNPRFKDWGKSLTSIIVGQGDGLFETIFRYLYLFIPLLTMGIISRESVNGTNKLLFSSPIRLRQIITGKFLGMMIFNLLLVSVAGIFLVVISWSVQSPDIGLLLSAALGFYLLTGAYTAIAMFMSSLTNYQIVAAMSTFLVLAMFTHIGMFFQRYDFLRDLTWFLSFSGRIENLINGLITTKDLFYFLILISMFMLFTLIRMKGARMSQPWYRRAGGYLIVLIAAVLLGYTSSRPALTGYWDTTAAKVNTLPPAIQKILKDFSDDTLEVTLYTNLMGVGTEAGLPENRNNYLARPWERYTRFKPDIQFRYEYYYDVDMKGADSTPGVKKQIADKLKEGATDIASRIYEREVDFFKSPEEMRKKIDLRDENFRLVMQVKYKGRSAFLRTFDDPDFWPKDAEISAALKRLQVREHPTVYFLTGNLGRSIRKNGEREYSAQTIHKGVRYSLVNRGFNCDTLDPDSQNFPSNPAAIVLSDPKTSLSNTALERLKQYIDTGGNLMIFGEPGKQAITNPVLQQLGVRLMNGQLVQPSYNYAADRIMPYATDEISMLSQSMSDAAQFRLERKEKLWGLMPGTAAIGQTDSGRFNVSNHFLSNSQRAWLKRGELILDSAKPVLNIYEGDSAGTFTTALALTRMHNGKEQKIAVTGDADFASNLRIGLNFDYIEALYSWMNDGVFPVYAPPVKPLDVLMAISSQTADLLKLTCLWILPLVLSGMMAILLIRRKRK